MTMTVVGLMEAWLHYREGIRLQTALSGPIDALHEIYLIIDQDGQTVATGAVRINIAYLTGLPEARVVEQTKEAIRRIDWRADPADLLRRLPTLLGDLPGVVRALLDCTLHDAVGRRAGVPLAEQLGGVFADKLSTNQALFWGDQSELEWQAQDCVARGFTSLKLRFGVGSFERDCARLAWLRDTFGAAVELAVDVNGSWSEEEARVNLRTLESFGIIYVEQPIPPGDWSAIARLSQTTDIPIMLDESLQSLTEIETLARSRAARAAHLKIVKLGGIRPLLRAARLLSDAGIVLMIGQMNEGALATAAAMHCAMVVRPRYAELYGADGLIDDPGDGLDYRGGRVYLEPRSGLGVTLDSRRLVPLWEMTV